MTACNIEITSDFSRWDDVTDIENICRKAAETTFNHSGKKFLSSVETAEISILLTGDEHIKELNREYRNIDKPTNVLSFPLYENIAEEEKLVSPVLLGDIVISFETMYSEAENENKTLTYHVTHLIIHGVLHLLGYDHIKDDDAEEMEELEALILAKTGV